MSAPGIPKRSSSKRTASSELEQDKDPKQIKFEKEVKHLERKDLRLSTKLLRLVAGQISIPGQTAPCLPTRSKTLAKFDKDGVRIVQFSKLYACALWNLTLDYRNDQDLQARAQLKMEAPTAAQSLKDVTYGEEALFRGC
ncbi:MAG: hypothetical protein Q9183_006235 [Haloplaca sp. 2 TL-2023]